MNPHRTTCSATFRRRSDSATATVVALDTNESLAWIAACEAARLELLPDSATPGFEMVAVPGSVSFRECREAA